MKDENLHGNQKEGELRTTEKLSVEYYIPPKVRTKMLRQIRQHFGVSHTVIAGLTHQEIALYWIKINITIVDVISRCMLDTYGNGYDAGFNER